MIRKQQPTLQNKKRVVLLVVILGAVIAITFSWYWQYHKPVDNIHLKASTKLSAMEAAFNQGQNVVAEALSKYVQVDGSFFKTAAKECYVSGAGYASNANQLDCSITSNSKDGGYVKADSLTDTQLASLINEISSQLTSKGYTSTPYIQESVPQFAVVATHGSDCSLGFTYNRPLPYAPDDSTPQWATTTSSIYYRLSCDVPIVTKRPGTFQTSCNDTYKSQAPQGYVCN